MVLAAELFLNVRVEGMSVVGCCCGCCVVGFFEVNYDSPSSARSKFGALEKSFFPQCRLDMNILVL